MADAKQRALPKGRAGLIKHMARDHGVEGGMEEADVLGMHGRVHKSNPWGVSGHSAVPHYHSELDDHDPNPMLGGATMGPNWFNDRRGTEGSDR